MHSNYSRSGFATITALPRAGTGILRDNKSDPKTKQNDRIRHLNQNVATATKQAHPYMSRGCFTHTGFFINCHPPRRQELFCDAIQGFQSEESLRMVS
jgi:hypothetical protein